jgi:tetratricopeptide (TPR) repeat protein
VAYNNNGQRGPVTDSLFDVLEGLRGQMTRNEELSIDSRRAWWDGDLERAGRAFEEAYRLDPVGRVGGQFEFKLATGEMTEAARLLEEMDLPGPCPFPGYYSRGVAVYASLGRYQDELDLVHEANALYPGRFVAAEADALLRLGRDAAVDSLLRTLDDEPLEVRLGRHAAVLRELHAHGRVQAADSLADVMLAASAELQTRTELLLWRTGILYDARRFEEAYAALGALEADSGPLATSLPTYGFGLGDMARVAVLLVRVGQDEEAAAVLAAIDESFGAYFDTSLEHAMVAAARGDGDEATRLLVEGSSAFTGPGHSDPAFDLIRDDPRFVAATTPR